MQLLFQLGFRLEGPRRRPVAMRDLSPRCTLQWSRTERVLGARWYGLAMAKATRLIVVRALVALTVLALCACGGSRDSKGSDDPSPRAGLPENAVARVGTKLITRTALDQLMAAMTGLDFYTTAHVKAPAGLAVDPPDYPMCVVAMRRVVAKLTGGPVPFTSAQLSSKCREFDRDMRIQAMGQAIDTAFMEGADAEVGVTVSNEEVKRVLAGHFRNEANLKRFLQLRDWTMADEVAQLKTELLSGKLLEKFEAANDRAALASFATESTKRWRARTICRSGYIVSECSDQPGGAEEFSEAASPAAIIEQLARLRKPPKVAPDLECKNTQNGTGLSCRPVYSAPSAG